MARRRHLDHADHEGLLPCLGHDGAAGQEPRRVRRTANALHVDAVVGRGEGLRGGGGLGGGNLPRPMGRDKERGFRSATSSI